MSADDDANDTRATASVGLVKEAQERVHDARSNYSDAKLLGADNTVDRVTRAEFQSAVLDYYFALRRSKDESAVKEFWEDVELWEEWTGEYEYYDEDDEEWEVYKEDDEDRPRVLKRADGEGNPRRIDKFDDLSREPIFEPVTGFETLEYFVGAEKETSDTVSDLFGTRDITRKESITLTGSQLIIAANQLDIAAAKLGFAPPSRTLVADPDEAQV